MAIAYVVVKSNEDLYDPKSLDKPVMNKFVNPWVVVISLPRSGRLLSTYSR